MRKFLDAISAVAISACAALIVAGSITMTALFFVFCACLGVLIRLAPVVIVAGLAWAVAEHQGWVNLVEWM